MFGRSFTLKKQRQCDVVYAYLKMKKYFYIYLLARKTFIR